jgi:hypothetical protein
VTTDSEIRVLKVSTCPSLSGRSTLTYQIACSAEAGVMLRVSSNSGGGYFSKEWVPFAAVDALLIESEPLTFSTLQPLFEGRSVNTGGFLMAVLKSLGVIKVQDDNPRCHERGAIEVFTAEVDALMASAVSLGEDAKPEGGKGRRKTLTLPRPAAES